MLGDRILSQSEVIRAILLEDGPFCGVPHLVGSSAGRWPRPLRGGCTGSDGDGELVVAKQVDAGQKRRPRTRGPIGLASSID